MIGIFHKWLMVGVGSCKNDLWFFKYSAIINKLAYLVKVFFKNVYSSSFLPFNSKIGTVFPRFTGQSMGLLLRYSFFYYFERIFEYKYTAYFIYWRFAKYRGSLNQKSVYHLRCITTMLANFLQNQCFWIFSNEVYAKNWQ